jgi:hypothetical protein
MAKKNGEPVNKELVRDYAMLGKMASDLKKHQKKVVEIGKRISRRPRSDFRYGIIENLDLVATHMSKACSEVSKAQKKLGRV